MKHFFVDTNIVFGYFLYPRQNPGIKNLIRSKKHKFSYTETVREEVMIVIDQISIKEWEIDKYFKFVDSEMNIFEKDTSLEFYNSLSIQRSLKNVYPERKLLDGEKNLLKILEANTIRFSPKVSNDIESSRFLTNNRTFYTNMNKEKVLEDTVYLMGIEDLIPVVQLADILGEFSENYWYTPAR